MRKFLLSLLMSAAFVLPVAAQNVVTKGQIVFTVPSQDSNGAGVTETLTWENTTGAPLYISEVQIWNGIDAGTQADVIEEVVRKSDGSMLLNGNHDDYVNGGPVRIQKETWGNNYVVLAPGDSLDFVFGCNNFQNGHCAWNVTIWTIQAP